MPRASFRALGSAGIVLGLVLGLAAPLAFALTFPALSGRVVDEAAILDPQARAALAQKLAELEARTRIQLVVVTLKSLQGTSIEDYGYQLGRHWGIGQKGENNGALLIVAPQERKVRVEVGYGLEGTLTDAVSKLIIENAILPRFRAGDFPGGITRGVDDVIAVLSGNDQEWKERAAKRPDIAPQGVDIGAVILLIVIFIIVVSMMSRGRGFGPRRRGPWAPVIVPGGGWGGGSSGGSSGGGFSGGGGSFGGGGSSGSW